MCNDKQQELVFYTDACGRKGDKTDKALAFVRKFMWENSEKSPVGQILYVEAQTMSELHALLNIIYPDEISESTLRQQWYKQLHSQMPEPKSGDFFIVKIKKIFAPGFKKCNICIELKLAQQLAKTPAERAVTVEKYRAHKLSTRRDRDELERYKHECRVLDTDVGYTIDADDINKFPTPTTKAPAECLTKLKRIKNKITGVELWDGKRTLMLFNTLPDIRTGADLTMTIIYRMFNLGVFDKCVNMRINIDGASDNVNYTSIKAFCHLLVSAEKTR